ncbi:MAG TPA: HRDC domain-containing protein [Planctomycetaceae bacterium]|nr:HRDC domain-containing protein [Planctomycetaceae bacterium]
MPHRLITDQERFEELCAHLSQAGEVAFDTEFVSEHTYRPELCLLQFATRERSAAVDPLVVRDLSSWWTLMAKANIVTVVHGGREEVRFCLWSAGAPPTALFDVQIAEGLLSRSFPLNYNALVSRVLGVRTHGKETRTDWRRRPLSDRQIAYALEDVEHLLEIHSRQFQALAARRRTEWAGAEFNRFVEDLVLEPTRESWRRLPGIQSFSSLDLAVVRELYAWREAEALRRDKPIRRILRDDLIIELARRQPHDVADLLATRDMNRSDYRRAAPEMVAAIQRALALSPEHRPEVKRSEKDQDEQILAQLLSIALANRCAQMEVAQGLVGTTADLRHLVRWHVYGDKAGDVPRLMQGWRAEVCGDLLTDVLAGKIALRVGNARSDHPLLFERREGSP